ncbi:MAG: hypothetical protein AAGA48_39475 [Myxococcota bacterium]
MFTLVALVAIALLQGWLMQTAVALTGDPAPRFGRALGTGLFALVTYKFTSVAWAYSVGAVMKFFVGGWLATGLGLGLAVLFATLVVKRRLRFDFGHALVITGLHLLFSAGAQYLINQVLAALGG